MIDFEKEFDNFTTSKQSSVITEVYEIIPSLNSNQQRLLHTMKYFANKYDLTQIHQLIEDIKQDARKNKNLNFFNSAMVGRMLKSMSLADYIGTGVSGSSSVKQDR